MKKSGIKLSEPHKTLLLKRWLIFLKASFKEDKLKLEEVLEDE